MSEVQQVRAVLERTALERAVRRPAEPQSPQEYRRLYRAREIPGYIADYRAEWRRNKRLGDALQSVVIAGSVIVTLTTGTVGVTGQLSQFKFRWVAMASSGLVAIAAGVSGHYKFRERAADAHRAADTMEYEAKAANLGIGRYKDGPGRGRGDARGGGPAAAQGAAAARAAT